MTVLSDVFLVSEGLQLTIPEEGGADQSEEAEDESEV